MMLAIRLCTSKRLAGSGRSASGFIIARWPLSMKARWFGSGSERTRIMTNCSGEHNVRPRRRGRPLPHPGPHAPARHDKTRATLLDGGYPAGGDRGGAGRAIAQGDTHVCWTDTRIGGSHRQSRRRAALARRWTDNRIGGSHSDLPCVGCLRPYAAREPAALTQQLGNRLPSIGLVGYGSRHTRQGENDYG